MLPFWAVRGREEGGPPVVAARNRAATDTTSASAAAPAAKWARRRRPGPRRSVDGGRAEASAKRRCCPDSGALPSSNRASSRIATPSKDDAPTRPDGGAGPAVLAKTAADVAGARFGKEGNSQVTKVNLSGNERE